MSEQFRREEDKVDEEYRRRILDTFVSSILLYEDRAEVKFNITDQKTGDFERVILPISANKKPPEDDDITSNSEGSTALRLVDGLQRRTNACLKISLHSVTIVLSILPKRVHH